MKAVIQIAEYLKKVEALTQEQIRELQRQGFLPQMGFKYPVKKTCKHSPTEERIHLGYYNNKALEKYHKLYKKQKGLLCINTCGIWMGDWDVSHPFNDPDYQDYNSYVRRDSITFKRKSEVITMLSDEITYNYPRLKLRLYETFAGIRAFIINRIPCKVESLIFLKRFKCDPRYIKYVEDEKAYWCRVSPKQYRGTSDFVVKYLGEIGNGQSDPKIMRWIQWHDKLCKKYSTLI